MSGLTVIKNGSRRIIIFTGDISDFPQELHDKALEDSTLEKAILTTAYAIHKTRKSNNLGEQMINMIYTPQKR